MQSISWFTGNVLVFQRDEQRLIYGRRVPEDENNEENDGMESFFAGKIYPVEKVNMKYCTKNSFQFLPQDKNVLKYRISKDGRVFRVLKEGGKEEVKALKEEEKVLEGEFYRPTVKGVLGRKTYSIELRNNTGTGYLKS